MRHANPSSNDIKNLPNPGRRERALKTVLRSFETLPPASILLVGGRDHHSIAVRIAEAAQRFDRRPSPWSHAALITAWNLESPALSTGLEASVDPERRDEQVPERNGVTSFSLNRYLDHEAYPNFLVAIPRFVGAPPDLDAARCARMREALYDPSLDRLRFPIWNLLGAWASMGYEGVDGKNPLRDGLSHPGAAYCEYVFGTAGIDITPGATAPAASPDLLYATLKYWNQRVATVSGVRFESYANERARAIVREKKLPSTFAEFSPRVRRKRP